MDDDRSPELFRYLPAAAFLLLAVSCNGATPSVAPTSVGPATTETVSATGIDSSSPSNEAMPSTTSADQPDSTTSTMTPTSQPGPLSTETSSQPTTTEAPTPSSDLTGFGRAEIRVGDTPLTVAVADTPAHRAQGLTRVEALPGGIDGMLFVFENASEVNFTMRRTLIPLDIWWFDDEGMLLGSTAMEPCTADPCILYPSPGPIRWALETKQDEIELSVGDVLADGP